MTDEIDKPRPPTAARGDQPLRKREPRTRRPEPEDARGGERIAKRLARAGISSRREAEALIADGRVRVNGQVLSSPAFNVGPEDRIELDGREIPAPERTRLFLFHKPAGVVTTNRDPEGRKTVFDVLPEGLPRLMTVGRLDINTEGLLLLTNDGGLARVLELPATGWLRRYRVRVHGEVDEARLKELAQGISVDGVFYGAIEAELERTQGSNAWLVLGLREGKNREVKNVLGALGLEVARLIRVSYGPFQLGELAEGQVQELKGRTVREQLGERLIEEAGADFEAEVRNPFTNRPTARGQEPASARPPAAREERPAPGEGGLIKNRRRRRDEAREDALGRLSTRPERRPFGPKRSGEREAAQPERGRTSNVWMAPGARPQGKDKPAGPRRAAPQDRRYRQEERTEGERKPSDRPFHERHGERRDREEGARFRGGEGAERREYRPRPPRDDAERRPFEPRRREGDAGAGRPFAAREEGNFRRGEGGERPFRPRKPREDGERAPFKPRRGEGERGEQRAGQEFRREGRQPFKPRWQEGERAERREGGGFRPRDGAPRAFGPRPRREEGERAPFRSRRSEGEHAAGQGDRPERTFRQGNERPFKPRGGEGGGRPFGKPSSGAGAARPSLKGPRPFKGKPREGGGGAGPGRPPRPPGGKRPPKPRGEG